MACRLYGAKPLPEPVLIYCQLNSFEHISVKFESDSIIFILKNTAENLACQNGGHFKLFRNPSLAADWEIVSRCWNLVLMVEMQKYQNGHQIIINIPAAYNRYPHLTF